VHVPVDKTRQYQVLATGDCLRCWRWCTLPDRSNGFAAHCDVTFANDGFGGDDGAGDHAVEWC
jgi:hypothetical protein